MKTLFAFFRFYYHMIRKSPKKYDIAMNPNEGTSVVMMPIVAFLIFLFVTLASGFWHLGVWFPLLIPVFFTNFALIHITREKGYKILDEQEEQRREAERLQREKEYYERMKKWEEDLEKLRRERAKKREEEFHQRQREREHWENRFRQSFQNRPDQNKINAMKLMGLSDGFTKADVKKAYRKLSKVHHPDCGGLQANFIKLTKAYNYLMDRI